MDDSAWQVKPGFFGKSRRTTLFPLLRSCPWFCVTGFSCVSAKVFFLGLFSPGEEQPVLCCSVLQGAHQRTHLPLSVSWGTLTLICAASPFLSFDAASSSSSRPGLPGLLSAAGQGFLFPFEGGPYTVVHLS